MSQSSTSEPVLVIDNDTKPAPAATTSSSKCTSGVPPPRFAKRLACVDINLPEFVQAFDEQFAEGGIPSHMMCTICQGLLRRPATLDGCDHKVLRALHQATFRDTLGSAGPMDDGEGGALPDLHAELQDWRDPDMVGLAKVAPAGRQCAQRALPQPFPLLLHACANERPPGARLSTASDMLSRRWVPGESAGARNRAPALSPLPADARSLPPPAPCQCG